MVGSLHEPPLGIVLAVWAPFVLHVHALPSHASAYVTPPQRATQSQPTIPVPPPSGSASPPPLVNPNVHFTLQSTGGLASVALASSPPPSSADAESMAAMCVEKC